MSGLHFPIIFRDTPVSAAHSTPLVRLHIKNETDITLTRSYLQSPAEVFVISRSIMTTHGYSGAFIGLFLIQ
jgi:hypothetical protein